MMPVSQVASTGNEDYTDSIDSIGSIGSIGIFDSGVGGLSVLRHVRAALPAEKLVYCADAAYAPYGDRPEALIVERALAIAAYLVEDGAKALVVGCNTATAAAIAAIRIGYPQLVVVGVEPGLKPAAASSASRVIGVLATTGTLASARFAALQSQIEAASGVRFVLQPCPGLADQVEKGELRSAATMRLIDQLVRPLLAQGADTLVLGCTHYPFVTPLIAAACANGKTGAPVQIIDTGAAVARQLVERLRERRLLRKDNAGGTTDVPADLLLGGPDGGIAAVSTGSARSLALAFKRLLGIEITVASISAGTEPRQP